MKALPCFQFLPVRQIIIVNIASHPAYPSFFQYLENFVSRILLFARKLFTFLQQVQDPLRYSPVLIASLAAQGDILLVSDALVFCELTDDCAYTGANFSNAKTFNVICFLIWFVFVHLYHLLASGHQELPEIVMSGGLIF